MHDQDQNNEDKPQQPENEPGPETGVKEAEKTTPEEKDKPEEKNKIEPVQETAESGTPKLAPSAELEAALKEAMESVEGGPKKQQKQEDTEQSPMEGEGPAPPSKREMDLKMQILDLRNRIRELEKELEQKAKEVKQNFDQGKSFQEKLEATRNRMMREKADWFNYGHEPLLREILTVVDNLERALHHSEKAQTVQGLHEGVEMTGKQLMQVLEKFGVKKIQALNSPFDPSVHEAMMEKEDDSVPPQTVIEEHQRGYFLKDRLLRPSMVTVSRKTKTSNQQQVQATEEKESRTPSMEEENNEQKPGTEQETGIEDPEV